MKKYLKYLSISVLFIAGCQSTPEGNAWEAELKSAANELNQSLPMMVDSETRLDSTLAFKNSFLYKYTMINYTVEDINIEQFSSAMRPQIVNSVCTTEDMKVFVQNHTEVKYLYHDKDGKFISQILVKTEECSKV
jgi:hypothetical protein